MQVIHLTHPYKSSQIHDDPVVLALGFFDGVHLGHQEVIHEGRKIANQKNQKLALMTFNHSPQVLYQNLDPNNQKYLSPIERKIELMTTYGVDRLYLIDFTYEFGEQSPQTFVDDYIVGLNATDVVAGFDYTYGLKHEANMQTLPQHAKGRFEVHEIGQQSIDNHKIGSRYINQMLAEGQIEEVNKNLGYSYEIKGTVIHGQKRGRKMGFPTANLEVDPAQLLPRIGVYVTSIFVRGKWYQSMTSVGYNTTFSNQKVLHIETNILNFEQMIYGEQVRLKFHHYLRDEEKFDSMEELIAQLHQDLENTSQWFDQRDKGAINE